MDKRGWGSRQMFLREVGPGDQDPWGFGILSLRGESGGLRLMGL